MKMQKLTCVFLIGIFGLSRQGWYKKNLIILEL